MATNSRVPSTKTDSRVRPLSAPLFPAWQHWPLSHPLPPRIFGMFNSMALVRIPWDLFRRGLIRSPPPTIPPSCREGMQRAHADATFTIALANLISHSESRNASVNMANMTYATSSPAATTGPQGNPVSSPYRGLSRPGVLAPPDPCASPLSSPSNLSPILSSHSPHPISSSSTLTLSFHHGEHLD